MLELTYEQAVINIWIATLLWVFFSAYASVEALPLMIVNRRTCKRWADSHDEIRKIATRGDYRRSRNFFIGFSLALIVGLQALVGLILAGPQDVKPSLLSVIVTYIFVTMLFAFWRAKHADRSANKSIDRYIQKHPELFKEEEQADE